MRHRILLSLCLLLATVFPVWAVNTCSPATVRDGSGGVDGISQYGARINWTTNNYTSLTNHLIAYWPSSSTATDLVVNASNNTEVTSASHSFVSLDVGTVLHVFGGTGWTSGFYTINSVSGGAAFLSSSPAVTSTAGGTYVLGPYVLQLNPGGTTWSGGVLGGILGGSGEPLLAGTNYSFSPFSSDTSTLVNGFFSSTNVCTSYVGNFTTQSAQSLAQRHPTPPAAFIPPTIPSPTTGAVTIPTPTGTTWHDGINCTGFNGGSGCVTQAQPGDLVLLKAGTTYNCAPCYLPSNPNLKTITVANQGSGILQTTATITFTANQQIIFDIGDGGSLPQPLQTGPAGNATDDPVYTVTNISGNTFQVKDNTGTLVTSFATAGSGTLYAIAWPLFTGNWVEIDSDAPAANLPPPGVNLDQTKYASSRYSLNNTGGNSFQGGYFATGYILRHAKFTAPATGSTADPLITQALIVSYSNHGLVNVVFDQDWFAGPARPDRFGSNDNLISGSNFAVTNSVWTNHQSWQPIKNSTLTASGNVITLSAGKNWDWNVNGLDFSLASPLTATITGSGAFNIYWDLNGVLTIAPGTGVTVSSATGFTVLAAASVTACAFPLDSNNQWNVYPIGCGTVSGSTVTATDENSVASCTYSANNLGMGPGEGTNCFSGATENWYLNQPGPYTSYNNRFVGGTGIVGDFFDYPTQDGGGTQAITTNVHDVYIARNSYGLDLTKISVSANVPADHAGYGSFRNLPEFKACVRCLVSGNQFGPSVSDVDGAGTCIQFPQLGSALTFYSTTVPWVDYQKTTDIEIVSNSFTNCATVEELSYNNGTTFQDFVPTRVWTHNNLITYNLDPTSLWSGYQYTSAFSTLFESNGTWDGIWEHNTAYGRGGSQTEINLGIYAGCVGCLFQNNIEDFTSVTGTTNYPDLLYNSGGAPHLPLMPAQGQSYLTAAQSSLSSEVWLPTWTNFNGGTPTSWTSGQLAGYISNYPTGVTFQSGAGSSYLYTDVASAVSWFSLPNPTKSANGSNFRLRHTSPYISGGSSPGNDGLDRGADIDALEAAEGKLSNLHTFKVSSTGLTVGFLAPDGYCVTVDADPSSDNSNFTPGTFTRFTNSCGNARVQNVSITGLTAHGTYTFRVNGTTMQPTFTLQLP